MQDVMMKYTIVLANGTRYSAPDDAQLIAWSREGRIPPDAVILEEGRPPITAGNHPLLPKQDTVVSTIIPYKNAPALIGYYTGIAALIPFVGIIAGPVALALGIIGIRAVRRQPERKGTAHAIIALVLGLLSTLVHWGLIVGTIISSLKYR